MTPERFEILAEAYGGDVARWPEAEREASAVLMAAQPALTRDILARAGDLDALLDAFAAPRGSLGLSARIAARAPKARAPWFRWLAPAGMGVGLAAACAAGVMAGSQVHAVSSTLAASDADALVAVVGDDDVSLLFEEDA